jgi:general secretion pathway protein D
MRWTAVVLLSSVLSLSSFAQTNGASATTAPGAVTAGDPAPSRRHIQQADDAYLAGAKKLEHDDLDGAEQQFQRALKLNPTNLNYALAISVTREHRVGELVRRATSARQAGDGPKADTLLAQARAIDPENRLVTEHSLPAGPAIPGESAAATAERARLVAAASPDAPWKIAPVSLAPPLQLQPQDGQKNFHLRGTCADVIRNIAVAFGIRAVIDDSLEMKSLRFDLEHVTYGQAMRAALQMAGAFATPIDETSVIVARENPANHLRLDQLVEETIYVPGLSSGEISELMQVVKSIFHIASATAQPGMGNIVVRAPAESVAALNRTITDLLDSPGEVMIEVKLYEVSTTHAIDVGATIPQQFNVFNVQAEANNIVNQNQALVQQLIAQGAVPPGSSNLKIALALIGSGLVQSSLASNLIGVFGGGFLQTGISGAKNVSVNLGLNSSDSRALDDVQLRVGDRQTGVFRAGDRYPITQATYTSGVSSAAASAVGNATINGVSVASLLSQFAGGTTATVPQITYEDLGVTLNATPTIEKSGRVAMKLDLKIEALSGNSLGGNPILDSRQFTTGLTIADGESAMMVSNVSKSEAAAITGLPGLSELPGFQVPLEENRQHNTSQLVVVVTPHIVRRRPEMIAGPRIPMSPGSAN